jgi:hypothetical protein
MPLISDHALLTIGADHTLCSCSFGCNAASQRILSNHIGHQSANPRTTKKATSARVAFLLTSNRFRNNQYEEGLDLVRVVNLALEFSISYGTVVLELSPLAYSFKRMVRKL